MNSISLFVSAPCHLQQMTAVIPFVISEEVPVSVILAISPTGASVVPLMENFPQNVEETFWRLKLDLAWEKRHGGKPPLGAGGGGWAKVWKGFPQRDQENQEVLGRMLPFLV